MAASLLHHSSKVGTKSRFVGWFCGSSPLERIQCEIAKRRRRRRWWKKEKEKKRTTTTITRLDIFFQRWVFVAAFFPLSFPFFPSFSFCFSRLGAATAIRSPCIWRKMDIVFPIMHSRPCISWIPWRRSGLRIHGLRRPGARTVFCIGYRERPGIRPDLAFFSPWP